MPQRVSEDDLEAEFDTTASDEAKKRAISSASQLTDDVAGAGFVSEGRLENIEMYLALHFLEATDQQAEKDSVSGKTSTYQGDTGRKLSGTKFGQRAMVLDPSGYLEQLDEDGQTFANYNVSP